MGKYNDAMCSYLSKPDVFADYWNGVVFDGNTVLKPEQLESRDGTYYDIKRENEAAKAEKKTKRRSRDVVKKAKTGATYVIFGIENQEDISYAMPVRHLEYDAMEYSRQAQEISRKNRLEEARRIKAGEPATKRSPGEYLSGFYKEDKLNPVLSLTFYHGEEPYDGCKDLHSMLNWNQEMEPYRELFPNYPLHLVTLDDIREELFQTGLRELIGVMKRREDKKAMQQYCRENEERFFALDEETVVTIGVMTNMNHLPEYRREEGGVDMCKAFEDMKEEGRVEERMQSAKALLEMCREFSMPKEAAVERTLQKVTLERSVVEDLVGEIWTE